MWAVSWGLPGDPCGESWLLSSWVAAGRGMFDPVGMYDMISFSNWLQTQTNFIKQEYVTDDYKENDQSPWMLKQIFNRHCIEIKRNSLLLHILWLHNYFSWQLYSVESVLSTGAHCNDFCDPSLRPTVGDWWSIKSLHELYQHNKL